MPAYVPDPYSSNISTGGVQAAVDQNGPASDESGSGDPIARPEFLEAYIRELIEVRNAISNLWAEQYGNTSGIKLGKPEQLTVAGYERDRINRAARQKLERRENELMAVIKSFTDIGSLGDAAVVDENTYVNEVI